MKAFLICPVRGHDMSETVGIVRDLESMDYIVHWPPRDTDQSRNEYRVCLDNLLAISKSDIVFVVWDGISQGCLFDLGMAFALGKTVKAISIPALSPDKSFQNLIDRWERVDGFRGDPL